MSNFRFAARSLTRTPGFTLTAVAALALGIGANTAIFSLVNQVLLNPPGIADPARVVAVRVRYEKLNMATIPASPTDFDDARKSTATFDAVAAQGEGDFNYTGAAVPERLQGAAVTQRWFDVFGARPLLGRTFLPEEDLPNANQVVVLSYAAWKRLFGGDPSVLGRTMELNYKTYRIIGVMGPEFRWPRLVELWAPLGNDPKLYVEDNRFNENLYTVARMKPGVTLVQANAQMNLLTDRVRSKDGNGRYARSSGWGMFAVPIADYAAGDTKRPLLVLLGAVGFVLLIACANIAGLMLARASGRARDVAVRVALGAGRWDLLRQTLAESMMLAALGAVAGIALAYGGIRLLLLLAPEDAAAGVEPHLSLSVLAVTGLLSIFAGLLFGLAPAWQIARVDPQESLKGGGRSGTPSRARQRLRAALVIGEVAVALVLLVGAGLFLRSMARLEAVNPGFQPAGVVTATLSLPTSRYGKPEQQIAFYRALEEKIAALPGVASSAHGMPLPFSGMDASASFNILGRPKPPGDPGPHGNIRYVSPAFFTALGIPLRSGRYFTAEDRKGSEMAVIIDENLARQYWPGEDPLGKRMRVDDGLPWSVVVGVVGHIRHSDLGVDVAKGTYYFPMYQQPVPFTTVVLKSQQDPATLSTAIRQAVMAVDPSQPVHHIKTMQEWLNSSLAPRRFVLRLLAFFAVVALLLASLGLYGVISYSVTQRTQEIGIRMALGAQRGSVLSLVVGQGLRLAGLGVVLGLGGSIAAFALLRSVLYQAGTFDVVTFGSMAAVLVMAACLASYIPARRAMRVEPTEALRYE